LDDQKALGLRQLYLANGEMWLRARARPPMESKHVLTWLDALLELADILDASAE